MEYKNIARGKEIAIESLAPIENSYKTVEKGSKDMLTDGKIGDPSDCYGGEWAHFYRGVGRVLTLDLSDIFAVNSVELGFIHDIGKGIYSPESVRFSVSENGVDFHLVAEVEAPYPASFSMQTRAVYSKTLKNDIRARYVRAEFTVEVNSFADEFKVLGRAAESYDMSPSGKRLEYTEKNRYAARDSLGGVCDIPLIYFGYWPENERIGKITGDDFLPYLAYIDQDGNPIDTMFDSILMLMLQGRCPSGASLGYHGEASKLSDWEYVISELFGEGINLTALNDAVGRLKGKIFKKDYKHKVFLTAPVPKISLSPFGDMNGDGIEEKLLSTDDCVDAYIWFVDAVKRRFDAECFENLRLEGYFWCNESISRANRDDEEYFAKRCVEALHERGYKCIFIPYFQAGGCEKAENVGFDCTTMQPGLSFQAALQKNPHLSFADFTALCKKYGFGVELEIHQGVKNENERGKYIALFDSYLRECMNNGMMTETVHTYYQVAGPGVFHYCAHSKLAPVRAVYDKLYKFIKGTLTESDFAPIEQNTESSEPPAADLFAKEINVSAEEAVTEITEEAVTETTEEAANGIIGEVLPESLEIPEIFSKIPKLPEIPENSSSISEPPEIPENSSSIPEPQEIPEKHQTVCDSMREKPQVRTEKQDRSGLKKKIAIGAGIAAAVGAAYAIVKVIKEKD